MQTTTTSIAVGATVVDKWLRYHYNAHKVTEIIIKTSVADTIMTIALVGEKLSVFPDEVKNDE